MEMVSIFFMFFKKFILSIFSVLLPAPTPPRSSFTSLCTPLHVLSLFKKIKQRRKNAYAQAKEKIKPWKVTCTGQLLLRMSLPWSVCDTPVVILLKEPDSPFPTSYQLQISFLVRGKLLNPVPLLGWKPLLGFCLAWFSADLLHDVTVSVSSFMLLPTLCLEDTVSLALSTTPGS